MTATVKRWAVFVESNTTGHGEEMIHTARRLGLQSVLVSACPTRYPFHASARTLRADTSDAADVIRALATLPNGDGAEPNGHVVLVTSTSDRFVRIGAQVAAALDRPGPDPAAIELCNDKGRQRDQLADSGVSLPRYAVVTDTTSGAAAAARIGGPVVVKPVTGSGSVGVRLCLTPDEAAEHTETLLRDGIDERGNTRPARVLVEQAVPGRELSVEILAGAIVGISETLLGPLPTFVEVGHDHPARLTLDEATRLSTQALRAVTALGLDRQNAHIELRLGEHEEWVIEVNPRLPGGRITTLVRLATGVDMVENHLRHLIDDGTPTIPTRQAGAAIRFLLDTPESVPPPAGWASLPGVVEARFDRAATGTGQHGDFRDRIGYVIAVGDDSESAAARAETAVRCVDAQSVGCGSA